VRYFKSGAWFWFLWAGAAGCFMACFVQGNTGISARFAGGSTMFAADFVG
jgi:hypothetical protein